MRKGSKFTPEQKARVDASHGEAWKEKLRDSWTLEKRQKMAEFWKGRIIPQSTRIKVSQANSHPLTDEHRFKISSGIQKFLQEHPEEPKQHGDKIRGKPRTAIALKNIPNPPCEIAVRKELTSRKIYFEIHKKVCKRYFADIFIPGLKAIIECDAGYHARGAWKEHDKLRDKRCNSAGYIVVRIQNRKILQSAKGAVENALKSIYKRRMLGELEPDFHLEVVKEGGVSTVCPV